MSSTRILFVDDEPRILEGLSRSMYCMRGEWHMRFAGSGAGALEELAKEPADVVVSDMRMPGMDGSQFLSEVLRLYPAIVRVILSGQAEPESIVRATRTAHQCLSKPCEAPALKAAIARTTALRSILSSAYLAEIVGSVDTLPSPPKAYQELLACLRNPAANIRAVTDIIRRDIAMTAKIVMLANSGFFGLRTPIQNLERAVSLVGVDAVTTLVLGLELFDTDRPITIPSVGIEELSHHSFECAAWARVVALHEGLSLPLADAAFLSGIVHDLGKLVFATRSAPPTSQARAAWTKETTAQMEEHHAAVGGYLLGLWGFTDVIVEAVVWHHTPSRSAQAELGLCGLVHIGDQLAHESDLNHAQPNPRNLEGGYLESIGLADRWPIWRSLRPAGDGDAMSMP